MKQIHLVLSIIILLAICSVSTALAGAYLNSAHGNATSGVNRSSTSALGYAQGNCAHCHEQHASIAGSEPAPDDSGPSNFLLFTDTNPTSQTTNFCFQCHQTGGSLQLPLGITNNDYSATFGGGTPSTVSIDDAFNPALGSAHDLTDILTELTTSFSFTADDNPCGGCHNPHLALKNNSTGVAYNGTYYTNTAISRPNDPDNLWGDIAAERMLGYATALVPAAAYRAPFFVGANPALVSTTHEPDGQPGTISTPSVTGANTPDYTTFCLDCHQRAVAGTNPVRTIPIIPWVAGERHSQHGPALIGADQNGGNRIAPYTLVNGTSGQPEDRVTNFVLSCLDCHEPHGANQQNGQYLLRTTVNGIDIDASAGGIGLTGAGQWYWFCITCHTINNGAGTPHGAGIGAGSNCSGGSCHDHSGANTNF